MFAFFIITLITSSIFSLSSLNPQYISPTDEIYSTVTLPWKITAPRSEPSSEPSVQIKSDRKKVISISGKVYDQSSSAPLADVKVTLIENNVSVTTDLHGYFRFDGLLPGEYRLLMERDGFLPCLSTVKTPDDLPEFQLRVALTRIKNEITVTAEAAERAETIASSRLSLSGEQLRKLPGIFEDPSRALQNMAGVASSGDFKNDLIVRGGNPGENLFLIDHIKVPTLSHFGSQGAGGGAFGLLNPYLIQNIEFFSGGFPAYYGNALSSVTHLYLREGERSRISGSFQLSLFGLSGTLEGPLFSRRGSWIFSLRKDYFSVLPRNITHGMTVLPDFLDGQAKLIYDLKKWLRISVLYIGGQDDLQIEGYEQPAEQRTKIDIADNLHVLGTGFRILFNQKGVAHLTLFGTKSNYAYSFRSLGLERYAFQSKDQEFSACFKIEYMFFPRLQLIGGSEISRWNADHYMYYRGGYLAVDRLGFRFPRQNTRAELSTKYLAFYLQASTLLTPWLKVTSGFRYDFLGYTDDAALSPRFGLNFNFKPSIEMYLSYGIYYQAPETLWLNAHPENKALRFLASEHVVFGNRYKINNNIKTVIEIYTKKYRHYPVDTANPYLTMANQGGSLIPTFFGSKLLDAGAGYARGIEISVQGTLFNRINWMTNYSYSRVRFKALDGILRPGDFDYGHIINFNALYCGPANWNFSLKWRYTGGAPYTPFDLELSAKRNTSYFDLTKINTCRYPAYHRLDIRLEKQFVFSSWKIRVSFDIQNLYNRRNVFYKFWEDGEEKTVYFLPFVPWLALQFEF